MHDFESLKNDIIKMGLKPSDTVLIHSSVKSIGDVKGKADTILDVLMSYFSDGILMLPSHTWLTNGPDHLVYNPKVEPSCVGILSSLMLKRKDAYRSLHPTHSVVASGLLAKNYILGEEKLSTPTPVDGVYGRLSDVDGYILLVGVGQKRNTFIHAIEEKMDIENRFTKEPIEFTIIDAEETIKKGFHKHYNEKFPHLSENFERIEHVLIANNLIEFHQFGDAVVRKMRARDLMDFIGKMLAKEPKLFDSNDVYKGEN